MLKRLACVLFIIPLITSCQKEQSEPRVQFRNKLVSGSDETFIREFAYSGDMEFLSVQELPDGSFALCGNHKKSAIICLLSEYGNTDWYKTKKYFENEESSSTTSKRLVSTTNSEFALSMISFKPNYGSHGIGRPPSCLSSFLGMNEQSSSMWEIQRDPGECLYLLRCQDMVFHDDNIVSVGWWGDYSPRSSGYYEVIRYGKRIKHNMNPGDTITSLQSIGKTSDGGYIMCGEILKNRYNKSVDVVVVKLNHRFNIEKVFRYENPNTKQSQCIRESSSGYIFSGEGIGMTKIDTEGQVIWNTNNSVTYFDNTSDGNIICISKHFLIKIDANWGDILWSKKYKGETDSQFHEVHETAGGGFIIVGSREGTSKQNGLVIKTDSEGNI